MSIAENLQKIKTSLPEEVTLVAVSKTKPTEDIRQAYDAGQRVFAENKIQEMCSKYEQLPKDIEWHMIGHLQSNKIKYMAPFVSLVHGVDSLKSLYEIDRQGEKNGRTIDCLLQVHIAREDTKFGFDQIELEQIFNSEEFRSLKNTRVRGLMGMASFTDDISVIRKEFTGLKKTFDTLRGQMPIYFDTLSMGMSGDYKLALECGSTMVRIGSSIFGLRNYTV